MNVHSVIIIENTLSRPFCGFFVQYLMDNFRCLWQRSTSIILTMGVGI